MTALEIFGDVGGLKMAFVGDGNNVARSLATLCVKLGMDFALACPKGYELEQEFIAKLPTGPGRYVQTSDPASAVEGASVVYTDTWVSMGQEKESAQRVATFKGFQINSELMRHAKQNAVVMHCLPAYRGNEITDEIMERHASTIFIEAENRLHFQRSLVNVLLAEGGVR
jgi:ornithine carbamoyltransferase